VTKSDWPHQDLWDHGPYGPLKWIQEHGMASAIITNLLDEQGPVTEEQILATRKTLFVNQGWRLTPTGTKLFVDCYNHYKALSDENEIMTGRVLIGMDRAVRGPWAYRGKTIITFDAQTHFELQMVGGSARAFVEFKSG
jgi:hypothetical protein